MVDKTLNANCRYLDAILVQYHQVRITASPTALRGEMPTTAMPNWLRSSPTCPPIPRPTRNCRKPPSACFASTTLS
ncbi:hypothetical protein M8494_15920 [Serratia ureilytica]